MKSKIPLFFYPAQIVFVDDNAEFLSSLSMVFSKQFNVKLFSDAELALALAEREHPSLALVGFRLRDGDRGVDLAQALRDRGVPSVSVGLYTGLFPHAPIRSEDRRSRPKPQLVSENGKPA